MSDQLSPEQLIVNFLALQDNLVLTFFPDKFFHYVEWRPT